MKEERRVFLSSVSFVQCAWVNDCGEVGLRRVAVRVQQIEVARGDGRGVRPVGKNSEKSMRRTQRGGGR
jgi:hypothetical protein